MIDYKNSSFIIYNSSLSNFDVTKVIAFVKIANNR
jgi:hypothetical protein